MTAVAPLDCRIKSAMTDTGRCSARFTLGYMNVLLRKRVLLDFMVRHSGFVLLVAFGLAGLWVLDDYGVGGDAGAQRHLAAATFEYVFGDDLFLKAKDSDKFYGMAFELPLLLTERVLGLEDSRDIWISRHLITHLFFLGGGFFCYLLAYRLFGSRLLAALAMLMFLLHPRLYAHSFFNTKDIPFLSMFMICLYLTHRAFDRGAVWCFLILGVAVGVLINLRIMGATLFVAVLTMQFLDLLHTDADRKRVLSSAAVFVLSSLLTVYVSMPYLWSDPLGRSMEWFYTFSQHPSNVYQLFRGERFWSRDIHPPEYVPVWMSITTAPIMLVLGVTGMLVVLMRGACNLRDVVFRNARLRFGFLLIGCFVLPIVAVVVLSSNVYNGWRQMYFLHAPFCLLAVFGIRWLVSTARDRRVRFAGYGAVGAGLAAVAASMASIHPDQNLYFNFLVDRTTPEHLRTRYELNHWGTPFRHGLKHLLAQHPSQSVYIERLGTALEVNRRILPAADRHRLVLHDDYGDGDFRFVADQHLEFDGTEIYSLSVYSNTIFTIRDLSLSSGAKFDDVFRELYSDSKSDDPMISSDWNVYFMDGVLVYVREPCVFVDAAASFFLHLHPADVSDLPEERRESGFNNLDFRFYRSGGVFDGICLARIELPDYDIARISTGQFTSEGLVWGGEYNMAAVDALASARDFLEEDVHPVVRSVFDVYIHDGRLIYAKDVCAPDDREARFFLHVHPADVSDLPEERRESGYDSLDFNLRERGGESDGACFAAVELPAYEIASISTGQYTSDGRVWSEDLKVGG